VFDEAVSWDELQEHYEEQAFSDDEDELDEKDDENKTV
jgi:hypothetical protein